ncbi:MAG: CPBP family intramembrane metalloprotease [Flavobacteriales bacterium]|nr:CPBP family intramembrane metalloprotease [Flavobacteriales bacterium]
MVVLSVAVTFTMLGRWLSCPLPWIPVLRHQPRRYWDRRRSCSLRSLLATSRSPIFRGFLQPRITLLFMQPSVAVVLPSFLFGLAHYQRGDFARRVAPAIGVLFACITRSTGP